MRKTVVTVTLLLGALGTLAGYDGGRGFGILDMQVGGKATAMGGAFTAIADDATALLWNPAGLSLIDGDELTAFYDGNDGMFSHTGFVGYARTLSSVFSFGAGFKMLLSGFQQDDAATFHENQFLLATGLGVNFPFRLKMGLTLKLAFRNFDYEEFGNDRSKHASFFNLDLGILYPVTKSWNVGLKIENLIPNMDFGYGGMDEPVYTRIVVGTSLALFDEKLRVALDVEYLPTPAWLQYHLGLEYRFIRQFSVYAGLNGKAFSFGINLYLTDFSFYAVTRLQSGLDPGASFGLHYKIGKKKREYKSIEVQMQELTKGLDRFASGDYAGARRAFQRVLKENPKSETARRMDTMAANRLGAGDWRTQQDKDFLKKQTDDGTRLLDAGELAAARKKFKQALEVDPLHWQARDSIQKIDTMVQDKVRAALRLAVDAFIKNDLKTAATHLREVLTLQNDHKQARDLLTRIERLEKEAWEKMQLERRNLENAEIYYRRGMAFFQRNIYIDAVDSFRISWSYLESSRTKYWWDLAQKRLSALKVTERNVGKSDDLYREAMKKIQAGKELRQAIQLLEQALNYNPQNRPAEQQLRLLRDQLEKIVKKPFDEGVAAYQKGEYLEALRKWRQALDIDPDFLPAKQYITNTADEMRQRSLQNLQMGDASYQRGTDAALLEAIRYYKNAHELWEGNTRAKLGWERCQNQLDKKAGGIYQKGFEALKSNQNDRLQEAIDNFEQYLLLRPEDKQAKQFLADALQKKKTLAWFFTVDDLKKQGLRLYHNRDYERALQKFREVLQYEKNNRDALQYVKDCEERLKLMAGRNTVMQIFNDGIKEFKDRRYDAAVVAWQKILAMGSATDSDKKMVESYIKTAQEIREYNQNKYFIQGREFLNAGRLIEARDALQEALNINKQHSGARALLTDVQDRIRNLAFQKAKQGREFFQAGKYADSKKVLLEARSLRDDDDRITDQLEETEAALKLRTDGDALYTAGKLVEAIRVYAALRKLNPEDREVSLRVDDLSRRLADQSEQFIKRAQEQMKDKNYADALLTVNLVLDFVKYIRDEQVKKATTEFAQRLKKAIDDEIVKLVRENYAQGARYYSQGNYAAALPYLNLVWQYDKNFEQIRTYRRIAAASVEAANKAAQQQQQDQIQRLLYTGINLYRQGQYAQAIAVWNQILAISPGHSGARSYIARARFKLGQ